MFQAVSSVFSPFTEAPLAGFMSGCPLVSVVEDGVFVDAVCGEFAPNFRPLLTQVVEESGHQLKLIPGTEWQTLGRDRDLDSQFMDRDTGQL